MSSTNTRFSDLLKSLPLYLLPQHLLSRLLFRVTRIRSPLARPFIRWFIKAYAVRMDEAAESELHGYACFNDFFTRPLKPGIRPIAPDPQIACPVDGRISELGKIQGERIFQAKGHDYTLAALLANETLAAAFQDGRFATLYLAPCDYHRIHMPLAGELSSMTYVPGRLFSVAPHTVRTIPRLFARNERLVCHFKSATGEFAMVLVGAINVAAIETVWSGLITPPRGAAVKHWRYDQNHRVRLAKGEEMGRFNMGSTVILLCQQSVDWAADLHAGHKVQLGQALGVYRAEA